MLALVGLGAAALGVPGVASADQSQLWWTDWYSTPQAVVHTNADGTGANYFAAAGAWGTAFDLVNQRVMWFDYDSTTLKSSDLNGGNPGPTIDVSSVVGDPYGITFDQDSGRIYYAGYDTAPYDTIYWATPDGANATRVAYQGSNAREPYLTSVDPSSNRVYWMNDTVDSNGAYTIGWASTTAGSSDSGEITRAAGGACSANNARPYAYLVLPQRGEIIWYLYTTDRFERTDMDGSNCRLLTSNPNVAGSTNGLAFDVVTNRVLYFGNNDGELRYFDVDDPSISGTISLSGPYTAIQSGPQFPVIVGPPTAKVTLAPVEGAASTTLRCTASFYPGIPSANYYSAPTSATTYAWSKDGTAIADAASETYSPTGTGTYRCTARASNLRGEGSSESEPYSVTSVVRASSAASTASASGPSGVSGAVLGWQGAPSVTSNAIVVRVKATREGALTLTGTSKAGTRRVVRCTGRATFAGPTDGTRVACRLTPAAKRLLCRTSLNVRLVARLGTSGQAAADTMRTVRVAKRNCGIPRVTG